MGYEFKQTGYVLYVKNQAIRSTSTSGGMCQLVSNKIIQQGGVVSGVFFDNHFQLIRGFAETLEELNHFNKSKYIQAYQNDSYKRIQDYLDSGRLVLFIGTPCEVEGLFAFLGGKPENLLCIDFVCLGVPSHKAWNKYLESIGGASKIRKIRFKDKVEGWKNFHFRVDFNDGRQIYEPGRENVYMQSAVIDKVSIRHSCYTCHFRNLARSSDITVADAWGTESFAHDLLDDKGTSSVMVNSSKGQKMMELLIDEIAYIDINISDLWRGNSAAWKKLNEPYERRLFYPFIEKFGFKHGAKLARNIGKLYRIIKSRKS